MGYAFQLGGFDTAAHQVLLSIKHKYVRLCRFVSSNAQPQILLIFSCFILVLRSSDLSLNSSKKLDPKCFA